MFLGYSRLLVTGWLHEPAVIPVSNVLHVNAALQYSPVLIQAYGVRHYAVTCVVPFPFRPGTPGHGTQKWSDHPAVRNLHGVVDLEQNCGYLTFANIGVPDFGCAHRERVVHLGRSQKNFKPGGPRQYNKYKSSTQQSFIMNENFVLKNESDKSSTKIVNEQEKSSVNSSVICDEEPEKLLQSPVESHFALTPETSSPANGFTSQDCTDLLQQELDKLDCQEIVKQESQKEADVDLNLKRTSDTADVLPSPGEDHVNMFSRNITLSEAKDDMKIEDSENGEVNRFRWLFFNCS